MDFSDFEFHKDKVPSGFPERKKYFEKLREKFCQEIKDSSIAQNYFKSYNPDSLEFFIENYAGRKAHLTECYDYYVNLKPKRELKYREKAESLLESIKQKKLFNLQLQWRAESITIKEIEFSYDFTFWSDHIDACPFIPPVTEQEIEVMKQYLQGSNDVDFTFYCRYDWQDYSLLMEKDEDGDYENPNEWYEFYDARMGTAPLLLLPNKRGIKEDYYEDLGRDYFRKLNAAQIQAATTPYVQPPPSLYGDYTQNIEFAKAYEKDKHFIELFELYNEEYNSPKPDYEIGRDEIDSAIDELEEARIPIFMPGGMQWRDAIVKCAQQYMNNCISNELDGVFEEYCMLNDLGISKGLSKEELTEEYQKDEIVQMFRKYILKGRELNGEPADFNF